MSRKTAFRVSSPIRIAIALAAVAICTVGGQTQAQINVITVDCTPFVSPNNTSFGPDNTMGMSLQQVDLGGQFNVTEVTPPAFRALTAAQLAAYDLIAINNNPLRLSDNCDGLAPSGIGTTWQGVIGINSGGRVFLTSHDAARFKVIVPPFSTSWGNPPSPCPGCEPFGADELIRQAALWAGGGNQTGLLMFNDSARFPTVGGVGWDNPETNLPAAWNITDADQTGGTQTDGGYTDILAAFAVHPIYLGMTDSRLGVNSLSSFAANISDGSYHSVFATYEPTIFTPTELVINAGVIDVGGWNAVVGNGTYLSVNGPDGLAVSLIRDETSSVPFNTTSGFVALTLLFLSGLVVLVARRRTRSTEGVAG